MGVYSEDRTMLSIDPMAESKVMPGYEAPADLYEIVSESIINDAIIYRSIVESEASILTLDEADGGKSFKRADTLEKLAKALTIKFAKTVASAKSVCAGTEKKLNAFHEKKVAKVISEYADVYKRNKDIAMSDRFTVKYDKKALLCNNKELIKFANDAAKASKELAKDSLKIAKNNAKEINANKAKVYEIPALKKYCESFCCCCGEKKFAKTEGNPFKDGVSINYLADELKNCGKLDSVFAQLSAGLDASLKEVEKVSAKLIADIQKNPDKVSMEDIEAARALMIVCDAITKGIVHAINDMIKCHKIHISECLRLYLSVAKVKAMRVVKESEEDPAIEEPIDSTDDYTELGDEVIDDTNEKCGEGCAKTEKCCKEGEEDPATEEPASVDDSLDATSDVDEKCGESCAKTEKCCKESVIIYTADPSALCEADLLDADLTFSLDM